MLKKSFSLAGIRIRCAPKTGSLRIRIDNTASYSIQIFINLKEEIGAGEGMSTDDPTVLEMLKPSRPPMKREKLSDGTEVLI